MPRTEPSIWMSRCAPRDSRCVAAILAAAAVVLAQCGSGGASRAQPPPDSPPAGDGVTSAVGPAGGTLRSPDGLVTIEIPAGALASTTNIEVQRIANTAPGGLGSAFRLLPAGTTFTVPVRITFAFTAADLVGTTLDAIGVGFAGDDGSWRSVDQVERTPTSVSVLTSHFSDWSRLVGWQLRPAEAHVPSGDRVALQVMYCEPTDDDGVTSLLAACTADDLVAPLVSGWAVDGVPGGNLAVGMLQTSGDSADYLAPIVAGEETFAVTVNLTPRRARRQVMLVSNITVGALEGVWTGTSQVVFTLGPTSFETTTASFVFEVDTAASTPDVTIFRLKSGTVDWELNVSDAGCTTHAGPKTFTLLPGEGEIRLVSNGASATLSAFGQIFHPAGATSESTCDGNAGTGVLDVGAAWLDVPAGTPAFPDGGATMSGGWTSGGSSSQWTFHR